MGTGSSNARILAFKNKVWLQFEAAAVVMPCDAQQSRREHLPVAATPNRQLRDSTLQAPAPPEGHINQLASLYTQNAGNKSAKKAFRAVPSAPERILDAPDLMDDYYLNLLDWSSTNVVSACIALPISSAIKDLLQAVQCRILPAGLSRSCHCTVQIPLIMHMAVAASARPQGDRKLLCAGGHCTEGRSLPLERQHGLNRDGATATHACPHAADKALG